MKKFWCLYMLEMSDHSYYTGITLDLEKRLDTHEAGRGSKYVHSRLPILGVVYLQIMNSHSDALKLEAKIKRLTKQQKKDLTEGKYDL